MYGEEKAEEKRKALAAEQGVKLWEVVNADAKKLPYPVGNAVGGGMHSKQFKKHPDFQEFLVIPMANKFSDNVEVMKEFYQRIGKELNAGEVNDEGAWQTSESEQEILDRMNFVRSKMEKEYGFKKIFAFDVAASTLFSV